MVVVHTATEVLLIKRVDSADLWQSVTGSLEWGESAENAAYRELLEETGIETDTLRSTGIRRNYRIKEAWKPRYHPNALRNHETLFYCELAERIDVQLNPLEHSAYEWISFTEAADKVFSWSNRLAILSLI